MKETCRAEIVHEGQFQLRFVVVHRYRTRFKFHRVRKAQVSDESMFDAFAHGYTEQNFSRRARMDENDGWMMSSRSTGNGGSCVEARRNGELIEVRNSKNPSAATVRFTVEEWDSFLFGAKRGEFDRLLG